MVNIYDVAAFCCFMIGAIGLGQMALSILPGAVTPGKEFTVFIMGFLMLMMSTLMALLSVSLSKKVDLSAKIGE